MKTTVGLHGLDEDQLFDFIPGLGLHHLDEDSCGDRRTNESPSYLEKSFIESEESIRTKVEKHFITITKA